MLSHCFKEEYSNAIKFDGSLRFLPLPSSQVWDTVRLLSHDAITSPQQQRWVEECKAVPQTDSFVHLHLGVFSHF